MSIYEQNTSPSRGFIADNICLAAPDVASEEPLVALVQRYENLRRQYAIESDLLNQLSDRITQECPTPKAFGKGPPKDGIIPTTAAGTLHWAKVYWRKYGPSGLGILSPEFGAAIVSYESKIEEARTGLELNTVFDRVDRLETEDVDLLDEIRITPARTLIGLVLKLRVLDIHEPCSSAPGPDDEGHDFWLHWKGDLLRDAERLAGLPLSSSIPFALAAE